MESRNLAQGVEIKVLSGEKMMMVFGGERRIVRQGDVYHVPSRVPHSANVSGGPVRVLDVFAPPREDYR